MPKFSTTGLFKGAGQGAAFGGSIGGAPGAGIGALLGGASGGLFGNAGEKKTKFKQESIFTPEQMSGLSQLLSNAQGGGQGVPDAFAALREYLNPQSGQWDVLQAPAMRNWNENLMPDIAERFAGGGRGMGGSNPFSGALSSSGFGHALSAGAAGMNEKLAAMRAEMQQDSARSLIDKYRDLSSTGLSAQPFRKYQQQGHQGYGMDIMNMLESVLGHGSAQEGFSQAGGGLQDLLYNLMGGGH